MWKLPGWIGRDGWEYLQRGGIPGGRTEEALDVINGVIEHSLSTSKPAFVGTIDACEAFNAPSYSVVEVAFGRLGAPPHVCRWFRQNLSGHTVRVRTVNGMDDPDDFAVIEGGAGQGQADSPLVWVVVMDIPITYAQAHGGRGYAVGRTRTLCAVCVRVYKKERA